MPRSSVPDAIDLRSVRLSLNLSHERMGRLLDVTGRTIERMESAGRLPRNAAIAERLGDIERVVSLGVVVYGDEGFQHFLTALQPRFNGRTAIQLIEHGETGRVLGALATDYEGSAT